MRLSSFVFLLLSGFSALSMDCDLAKLLNHPQLQTGAFWEDFGKINPSDSARLQQLIQKHAPGLVSTEPAVATAAVAATKASQWTVAVDKKASKAIQTLSPENNSHFDQFLKIINEQGPAGFYENPGKWHYERMKSDRSKHTIRLNGEIRVLFENRNGIVKIIDVGKHITH